MTALLGVPVGLAAKAEPAALAMVMGTRVLPGCLVTMGKPVLSGWLRKCIQDEPTMGYRALATLYHRAAQRIRSNT